MSFDLTLDVGATTFAALAVLIALLAELREYRRRRTAELIASVVSQQHPVGGGGAMREARVTYWLVIENTGAGTAVDVDLDVTTTDGDESLELDPDVAPSWRDDGPNYYLEVEPDELPLRRFGPGASYAFRWVTPGPALNSPTGERAEVALRWRDADPPWWRFRRGAPRGAMLPVKLGP